MDFENLDFEIVSYFDVRISNLNLILFRISCIGFRILTRGRLGAKNFVEVVLLNILSVRIELALRLNV